MHAVITCTVDSGRNLDSLPAKENMGIYHVAIVFTFCLLVTSR